MVKVVITKWRQVCWIRDNNDWFYCMVLASGKFYFDESGHKLENCHSKHDYYRIMKLKLLW